MIAGVLLLTVAGLLIAGGVVGAVSAARGVQLLPHSTGTRGARARLRVTPMHLVAVAAGVAVLLLTGWPVAAIAAAAAVVLVPRVLGGGRRRSG